MNRRPSFFEALSAIANVLDDDPRVQAALSCLDQAAPKTARLLRELSKKSPELVEGLAVRAVAGIRSEAEDLDESLSRAVSRAVDEVLVAGRARAPKEKRLRAGSKSRAQVAARRGRAKRA